MKGQHRPNRRANASRIAQKSPTIWSVPAPRTQGPVPPVSHDRSASRAISGAATVVAVTVPPAVSGIWTLKVPRAGDGVIHLIVGPPDGSWNCHDSACASTLSEISRRAVTARAAAVTSAATGSRSRPPFARPASAVVMRWAKAAAPASAARAE